MSDQAYIELPVTTEAADLAANAKAELVIAWPGWVAHDGNLEVVQIDAISPMAQNAAEVAALVPPEIFQTLGTALYGVPYVSGGPARATTTWTLSDSKGHTIEANAQIGIDGVAFTVDSDVVVPAGSFVATNVAVTATEDGVAGNNLSSPVEQITAYTWVSQITVVGSTSGGADPEDNQSYRNRLSTLLTLMDFTPVTAKNFALLARFTGVLVGRSLAIDGYNPATDTYDVSRYMFVAVTDSVGNAQTTTALNSIAAYLADKREANFIINVANHTYTTIDVNYAAVFYSNYDAVALASAVQTAIQDFLNPLFWGLPIAGITEPSTAFENETVVRIDKLKAVIDNVPGVNYTTSVVVADHAAVLVPKPNGDIQLLGPAPLPKPGTITKTG